MTQRIPDGWIRRARAACARWFAAFVFLLPSAALLHGPAHAEPVPDATYWLDARTEYSSLFFGPGGTDGYVGALPGSVAVDDPIHFLRPDEDPSDGFDSELRIDLTRVAHAETFGGPRPEAIATAEVRILAANVGFMAGARADAFISYFVQVARREDAGLVWQPALVPVNFSARAETSGPSSAAVVLREAGPRGTLFSDSASSFPGATRHAFDRSIASTLHLAGCSRSRSPRARTRLLSRSAAQPRLRAVRWRIPRSRWTSVRSNCTHGRSGNRCSISMRTTCSSSARRSRRPTQCLCPRPSAS